MATPGPGHCNYSRAFCEKCKYGQNEAVRLGGSAGRLVAHGNPARSRDVGRPPRRPPLARRRARRRHDAARQAALEGRSGRARRARGAACPRASPSSRRRTGRRRRAPCSPRILGARYRLAWNNSGANLASGVASTLLSATDAELGLLEVDEFALPEVMRRVRPRVVSLGNLFRDQLDRYGELEHIAERWRAAVAALPPRPTLVVNADDPLVASSPTAATARCASASTIHASPARRSSTRPTRSTASAAAPPTTTRPPTSGISATIAAPRAATPGLRSTSRPGRSTCRGSTRPVFDLVTPAGTARVRLPLPGLYNVYNALAAATTALALGTSLDEIADGLGAFTAAFGRFERIEAGDRRILMLLIKNPAGANEAVRTLRGGRRPGDARDRAQRPDRRRTRRLVDLGRRLRAAARAAPAASSRRGERAAELALRFTYAGFAPRAARGDPGSRGGARPRARARPAPAASSPSCPPTRRCSTCARSRSRAASCGRTGRRPREDPRRAPLSGLPQHLRRPRQHRRARPPRRAPRPRARGAPASSRATRSTPSAFDLLYVGGGQDREQALIAPDLAARGEAIAAAVETGTAVLAVCGGYQLLGRGYRGRDGSWMPGAGVLPARDASPASGG